MNDSHPDGVGFSDSPVLWTLALLASPLAVLYVLLVLIPCVACGVRGFRN